MTILLQKSSPLSPALKGKTENTCQGWTDTVFCCPTTFSAQLWKLSQGEKSRPACPETGGQGRFVCLCMCGKTEIQLKNYEMMRWEMLLRNTALPALRQLGRGSRVCVCCCAARDLPSCRNLTSSELNSYLSLAWKVTWTNTFPNSDKYIIQLHKQTDPKTNILGLEKLIL